jgi:hypothetical protein
MDSLLRGTLSGCPIGLYQRRLARLNATRFSIPDQSDNRSCARQIVIGFPQESVIGFVQESAIGFRQERVIGIVRNQ